MGTGQVYESRKNSEGVCRAHSTGTLAQATLVSIHTSTIVLDGKQSHAEFFEVTRA